MNREAVKTEITRIIEEKQTAIRWARQYKPAKHQIALLTELGIIDLMPDGFGHTDAATVIAAATQAKSTDGEYEEVWTNEASALYQMLNTPEPEPQEAKELAVGDVVEVIVHEQYSDLVGGAIVTPMQVVKRDGYKSTIVDKYQDEMEDESGNVVIEVVYVLATGELMPRKWLRRIASNGDWLQ